jgi:hypothetical protein
MTDHLRRNRRRTHGAAADSTMHTHKKAHRHGAGTHVTMTLTGDGIRCWMNCANVE